MRTSARFRVFENPDSTCARVAEEVALLIRERAILGRPVVLGLCAEKACLIFFKELVYLHHEEGLSFGNVITFNLDEYLGIKSSHPQSMCSFMHRHLFDHVDIPPQNIHFLSGDISPLKINTHCAEYEELIEQAGGIDFQIICLRNNGCLGVHNPRSSNDGRTQKVKIHKPIRLREEEAFGGIDHVPTHALSLGHQMIVRSRRVSILAWGSGKSRIVSRMVDGPVSPTVNASCFQTHPGALFYLDESAASLLKDK